MASSATFTSFLFLLTLFFSMQTHARESQFFSKFTNNNTKETPVIPNKEETTTKQNQEPTFIPETQGGYGPYGHESGQFPPTTTTTTPTHVNAATYPPYTTKPTHLPYKNEFDDEESLSKYLNTNDDHNNNKNDENKNYYYNTNGIKNKNYYFNKNSYEANQYGGFGDTKLTTERRYSTMANQNNYNERRGMSGKYYYDLNSENDNP
jgi:hypothetical protein